MTETSARSSLLPQSNTPGGRADHTSTAPNRSAQSNRITGAVDQTSARSNEPSQSKPQHDRADHTSTAPTCPPKRKNTGGAVDQTSARSSKQSTSNEGDGRADHTSTAPKRHSKRKGRVGVVDQLPATPNISTESNAMVGAVGPFLADPVLGILAFAVDDLEMVRIASENRLRALTSEHGLTLDNADVARMAAMVAQLNTKSKLLKELGIDTKGMPRGLEQEAILNMNRAMRRHPLWAWAKPITGVGEKQFARLLAVIGDPYWNDGYVDNLQRNRPRTIRVLRSYCGWAPGDDGLTRKRQRGQQSNWNNEARNRSWLIAESCVKQHKSIYRDVYDAARKQYEDTVHPAACVRCGPKGKPAQPGSPRSAGHQQQMALRKVAVAFLADLWREAKRLHEQPVAKSEAETQAVARRQVTPSQSGEQ